MTDDGNHIVYDRVTMKEGPYPNHLAKYMRACGITDPGLAQHLGISKQQIFNLRRGHRKLTVEWAKRLAPHLKVSWQELITGPAEPPEDQEQDELNAVIAGMNKEQRHALLAVAKIIKSPEKAEELASNSSPNPPAA